MTDSQTSIDRTLFVAWHVLILGYDSVTGRRELAVEVNLADARNADSIAVYWDHVSRRYVTWYDLSLERIETFCLLVMDSSEFCARIPAADMLRERLTRDGPNITPTTYEDAQYQLGLRTQRRTYD